MMGLEGKTLWDWLELLVIPTMLTFIVLFIEISEGRREQKNLSEQYKQDILRDYFNEVNNVVFDKSKLDALRKGKKYSPEREILGSRTIIALDILEKDLERKSQLIRFIGNSSLSRYIPIRRANLDNLDLSNVDLTAADLELTSLKDANLCGANLSKSNLKEADLKDAKYNHKTKLPKSILDNQKKSMKEFNSNICENDNILTKWLKK